MSLVKNIGILTLGAVVGAGAIYTTKFGMQDGSNSVVESEPHVLYWVAPMDANYRRDEPGKSPMGMDLVPVYEKGQSGGDDSPGTIEIAPEVVNNLGVRTAQVVSDYLQPEVRTVGYLQYNQDSIVNIHPRVDGWVEQSFVNSVGDPVKKGQKLYTLYSPALVNAQEELLFGLKRKDQRMARAAEERLKALQLSDSVIRKVKKSRKASQTVSFYAPTSGVVGNLNIREGMYVQPGVRLLSIANLDQIWLEAEVLERQAGLVKKGLAVEVNLDFMPGKKLEGSIDYVYPSLDAKTRTLKVRVRLDNPDHALKPNMFAELRIFSSDEEERLLIPNEAVIRGGQQDRVVIALGEGRFKSIAVTTGQRDNKRVEILDGLSEGETVVASAQFLLDSESSKTSDFQRMETSTAMTGMGSSQHEMTDESQQSKQKAGKPAKVWVKATINSIDAEDMRINTQHAAIPEWGWPEMVMDFNASAWVDLDELPTEEPLHIEVSRTESGSYEVTDFFLPEEK